MKICETMISKRLKLSKYAFIIESDFGYIIYSSATGAIIKISEKQYEDRTRALLTDCDDIIMEEDDDYIRVLFDSGILVPYDRDEYSYQRFLYEQIFAGDRVLKLTLLTTRQCNLRCIYCYEKHKDEYMNDEIFGNIITMIEKHFKNRVYNGVSISLFGGEPFCNFDDVYKFLLEVQKICKENNCSFACEATTNGVLVTPDRFEKLIRVGCTNYQISVDGVKETHDKHRVRVDGSGSWDIIMSNLKYMKKTSHMFKVIIRTNFDEEIIERAEEFYQYVKDNFDDDRFTIYYENIKKLGGENDKKLTSMSTVEKMVANISISELLERNNLKCELTESRSQPFGQMCPAIKHNSYVVDCDGTIMKCTLSIDDEINKVGKITDEGIIVFDYDRLSKLNNISFSFEMGKVYSLIGTNGAGKTTLLNLLCRLYDVTDGEILYNGIPIKQYNIDSYRALFSSVFQQTKTFALSIAENVALDKYREGDQEQRKTIYAIFQRIGMGDFIDSLPDGIDTQMGKTFDENGVILSGGQMQKIAIARALFRDSEILLFDEPSSALDPIAEDEFFNVLRSVSGGKMVFYVSHRLSSAIFADEILFIRDHKIFAHGPHFELLRTCLEYYEYYNAQAKYYQTEEQNHE